MKRAKIIIAPDSFKGSLSAVEVAEAAARGAREVLPDAEIVCLPVSDGGEGLLEAICRIQTGMDIKCVSRDALGNPVFPGYLLLSGSQTAVMESASSIGLVCIPLSQRDASRASSFGLGMMIADALRRGCRDFIVGLGGSATTDAGTGMLEALGFRFFDSEKNLLHGCGGNLSRIIEVDASGVIPELRESRFTVACDVSAPLYGPNGAAFVFSPQKGAGEEETRQLDAGLRSFAKVSDSAMQPSAQVPGAGAAGGLGYAFLRFLKGQLRSGIDIVLDLTGFDRMVENADLVITGEGRIDFQTLMGKAPSGVMCRARKAGVPVLAIAGIVADLPGLRAAGFSEVLPIHSSSISPEEAMDPILSRQDISATIRQFLQQKMVNGEKGFYSESCR